MRPLSPAHGCSEKLSRTVPQKQLAQNTPLFAHFQSPGVDAPCRHVKRSTAVKSVTRGTHRWTDSTCTAIQEIPQAAEVLRDPARPFRFGPSASFTDWHVRKSGGGPFVFQLDTRRTVIEPEA